MSMKTPTSWADVPIVLDIPYVAQLLGRHPETIRQQCVAGKLPAIKIGSEWRISKEGLIKMFET